MSRAYLVIDLSPKSCAGPAWGSQKGNARDSNQAKVPFLFPNYVQVDFSISAKNSRAQAAFLDCALFALVSLLNGLWSSQRAFWSCSISAVLSSNDSLASTKHALLALRLKNHQLVCKYSSCSAWYFGLIFPSSADIPISGLCNSSVCRSCSFLQVWGGSPCCSCGCALCLDSSYSGRSGAFIS